jgi:hypothetical protein
MPVELRLDKSVGVISGVVSCLLGLGDKRFYAPAGLPYGGMATKIRDEPSNTEVYKAILKDEKGVLVEKSYLPEL